MSYDRDQFRDMIERALASGVASFGSGFDSNAAVELLLVTAAVESDFGAFFRQLGGGPAIGAYGEESPTFIWTQDKFPQLARYSFEELEWNIWRATIAARCVYRAWPEPLPPAGDLEAQWRYYKKFYNSTEGATTRDTFMEKHKRYLT